MEAEADEELWLIRLPRLEGLPDGRRLAREAEALPLTCGLEEPYADGR